MFVRVGDPVRIRDLPSRLGPNGSSTTPTISRRVYDWARSNPEAMVQLEIYDKAVLEYAKLTDRGELLYDKLLHGRFDQARDIYEGRIKSNAKIRRAQASRRYLDTLGRGHEVQIPERLEVGVSGLRACGSVRLALNDSEARIRFVNDSPELRELTAKLDTLRLAFSRACLKLEGMMGRESALGLRLRGQVTEATDIPREVTELQALKPRAGKIQVSRVALDRWDADEDLADGIRPLVPARHSLKLDALRVGYLVTRDRRIKTGPTPGERRVFLSEEDRSKLLDAFQREQESAMGRPPTYGDDYIERARKFAASGKTNAETQRELGVSFSVAKALARRGGFEYARPDLSAIRQQSAIKMGKKPRVKSNPKPWPIPVPDLQKEAEASIQLDPGSLQASDLTHPGLQPDHPWNKFAEAKASQWATEALSGLNADAQALVSAFKSDSDRLEANQDPARPRRIETIRGLAEVVTAIEKLDPGQRKVVVGFLKEVY